ncbi:MAG: adenylate/guanylate cyclase domain-containing protein [Saprospiraceae bacterium]|nr:adenylate/guanylate cyclase domain-containing protein [Saprospiraceae bacterium]
MQKIVSDSAARLERLQVSFGSFAPHDVIEHLTDPDGVYSASLREVTVLFADLRGFTRLCHGRDPAEVVEILNGYFETMHKAVRAHHGELTELTGDGILALFGALEHNPWQEIDATKAAIAMRESLVTYNRELAMKGLPSIAFGIGIHQGPLLTGVLGSRDLQKFGVVGDAINVASRLEGLTKHHQCDILISEVVKSKLRGQFALEAKEPVLVKGRNEPVKSYHVVEAINAS